MRLPDFSFSSGTHPAILARAAEYNQYIAKVSAENFVSICVAGEDEPRLLPGILDSIEVSASLLVDDAETQSKSGSVKIISGWADADVTINLLLIDIPKYDNISVMPAITRFDCLYDIEQLFKRMEHGKPCVFGLLHPHLVCRRAYQFVFTGFKSSESRGKRVITCTLEFDEFDSVTGKSQDRQLGAEADAVVVTSVNPVIGDETRCGLGKLEERFAKL